MRKCPIFYLFILFFSELVSCSKSLSNHFYLFVYFFISFIVLFSILYIYTHTMYLCHNMIENRHNLGNNIIHDINTCHNMIENRHNLGNNIIHDIAILIYDTIYSYKFIKQNDSQPNYISPFPPPAFIRKEKKET
jgi:hypothetical protein